MEQLYVVYVVFLSRIDWQQAFFLRSDDDENLLDIYHVLVIYIAFENLIRAQTWWAQ